MATLRQEITVTSSPAQVWNAVADFTALHERLVPGFVTACTPEEGGQVRLITFANGLQVRERLVTRDGSLRRLVYKTEGGRATHYNGAVEVFEGPEGGSRLVWTIDLLPDELAVPIGQAMGAGVQAMKKALGA